MSVHHRLLNDELSAAALEFLLLSMITEVEASHKSALEGAPGYCRRGESGGASHLPRWRLSRHPYTSASGCSFLRFVRAVSSAEKTLPRPSHSLSSFNVHHKCHLLCEVPACPSRLSLCAPHTSLFMSPLPHLSQPDIFQSVVSTFCLSRQGGKLCEGRGCVLPSTYPMSCPVTECRLNPKHVGGGGEVA